MEADGTDPFSWTGNTLTNAANEGAEQVIAAGQEVVSEAAAGATTATAAGSSSVLWTVVVIAAVSLCIYLVTRRDRRGPSSTTITPTPVLDNEDVRRRRVERFNNTPTKTTSTPTTTTTSTTPPHTPAPESPRSASASAALSRSQQQPQQQTKSLSTPSSTTPSHQQRPRLSPDEQQEKHRGDQAAYYAKQQDALSTSAPLPSQSSQPLSRSLPKKQETAAERLHSSLSYIFAAVLSEDDMPRAERVTVHIAHIPMHITHT
eukprot:TRINITY_DN5019_c0_g1_i2.p1 TRINITY_DN5019_c0_g1~~TRINITY_DN5019_c0_g1_i2.p1  ORF type:complete len:261 (+),score=69.77 TRINITY_DN5019_c0_g1_i2:15-797(+)